MAIDPTTLSQLFLSGQLASLSAVHQILNTATALLSSEPTICHATAKGRQRFNVVGDIHGQYYDLQLGIFATSGLPSPTNAYCFNGDFVDRGSWSIECLLTLLAWKIKFPAAIYLTRGNHESKAMTSRYGFKDEVLYKYNATVYALCLQLFCSLPLGVVLDHHTFIVHGGLCSKNDGRVTLQELNAIDRFCEPPRDSGNLMMECLWSDPMKENGVAQNQRGGNTICFGPDITQNFIALNRLERVVRSHQVVDNGIESHHNDRVFTLFSAPNYCDRGGNVGAVIVFENESPQRMTFLKFKAVPHPDVAPMAYLKRRQQMQTRSNL